MGFTLTRLFSIYGVVLKRSEFGEGHANLTLLDRERGKIQILSFGSGRAASRKRSALLVSNLVSGVVYKKMEEQPGSLKEVNLERSFQNITSNLDKLSYLYLLFEVLDIILPPESRPDIFPLFLATLDAMDARDNIEKYVFYTLFIFLKNEGILPPLENPGSGTSRFIDDISKRLGLDFFHNKNISQSVISETLTIIASVVKGYSGKDLNSLSLFRRNP